MPHRCPQCGAQFPAGESCRDRFDLCLAKEFEQPTSYGSVHHLTVACYMLQHNLYSREAWLEAREMVAQFIHQGITPEDARRQSRKRFDSSQRRWSVTKGAKMAGLDGIVWTRTMADVRVATPDLYCADVKAWATGVLSDTEGVLPESSAG
jgi:hypothetical protein